MPFVLSQEPSLTTLWLIYGSVAALGFFLCRFRHWCIFLVLPFVGLLSIPLLIELYDPDTGRAIRSESWAYFFQAHAVLAIAFLAPLAGSMKQLEEEEKAR